MLLRFRPKLHIKSRIVYWVTIVVVVAIVLFTLAQVLSDGDNNRHKLIEDADKMVQLAAIAIATPFWNYDKVALAYAVDAVMIDASVLGVAVEDLNGEMYYQQAKRVSTAVERRTISVSQHISIGEERIGTLTLTMTPYYLEQVSFENRIRSLLQSTAMLIAIIVAVSLAMDYVIRPLVILEEKTLEIADGNLDSDIPVYGKDEVGLLAEAIRIMQQKLKMTLSEIRGHLSDLMLKNSEITHHKEEIESLYQQTKALNDELTYSLATIQENYRMTVLSLANAIEANDVYTKGHCERVTCLSTALGKRMGLNETELLELEFAALLHDIGKIGIPNHILNKPEVLTTEEYLIVKKHPTVGFEILKNIAFLEHSRQFIKEHHERFDGRGYPHGLAGEEISLQGRILCIADAYDAMVTARPYRPSYFKQSEAIEELLRHSGTQFDPNVMKQFIEVLKDDGLNCEPDNKSAQEA